MAAAIQVTTDLPNFWAEHIQQRRHSRLLRFDLRRTSRCLAAALAAKLHDPATPDFWSWLATLRIPHETADRLLALVLNPPAPPPALTLIERQLALRLTPQHAAIIRCSLESLAAAEESIDPAQVLTDALFCETNGLVREDIRAFLRRHPDESSVNPAVQLAPIAVPSPRSAAPQPTPSAPPNDDIISAFWTRFVKLRRAHRRQSRAVSQGLPELGRLLALAQDELAVPGRASRFRAFLCRHHIPRQTAYRLIRNYRGGPNGTGSAENAPSSNASHPAFTLSAASLSVRLTPRQAIVAHHALGYILAKRYRTDFSLLAASAFAGYAPREAEKALQRLWNAPPESFSPPRFQPRIEFFRPLAFTP